MPHSRRQALPSAIAAKNQRGDANDRSPHRSADEKKIEQKYLDAQAITSKVDIGPEELGMSQSSTSPSKESLRLWGQKQVEQILSSQTGLDMSLNLLNDVGGFDKFKESLNDTQSFTRVYSENAVVFLYHRAANAAPSILSLLQKGENWTITLKSTISTTRSTVTCNRSSMSPAIWRNTILKTLSSRLNMATKPLR
ncbi:hypothetical protein CWS02_14710 [Enterobacter sp. EA-1]|nr:hypothetical protein CWS02_14710 [Enterobacter sp. EA-1]